MTEVWKSNPRHFCTFCKCWIADNRPSRDFHERGKRHQECVKKRIEDMQKKSAKKAEEEKEMDETMKEIERQALKAFKKDVKSNPTLAAKYSQKMKEKEELKAAKAPLHGCEPPPADYKPEDQSQNADTESETTTQESAKNCPWQMAFSDEGYPYFWNTDTNEVQWTKPADYVSPQNDFGADRSSQSTTEAKSSHTTKEDSPEPASDVPSDTESSPTPEPSRIPLPTEEIPLPPEPTRSKDDEEAKTEVLVPEDKSQPTSPESDSNAQNESSRHLTSSHQPSSRAYGGWENIPKSTGQPSVDLQLPSVEKSVEVKTIKTTSEAKIKFRQKKSNSIADGLVAFKKRKLAQGGRNIKKREDDR